MSNKDGKRFTGQQWGIHVPQIESSWTGHMQMVVCTHALDFGTLLALTHAQGPSVIQVRTQDIMPQSLGGKLVQILRQYEPMLESGALIVVDETKSRVRILPFR